MKICPYCSNENQDTNRYCIACGAPLDDVKPVAEEPAVVEPAAEVPAAEAAPAEAAPAEPQESFYEPAQTSTESGGAKEDSLINPGHNNYNIPPVSYNQQVTPIPIGGYVAWSIAVILFCTIPGVIALYYVLKINKATTVEEQQQTLSTAKKVLIVGTALAVINLISTIGMNM